MSPPKQFIVIAYDIASDRRRRRIEKLLKQYGVRVNFSVFECRLSPGDIGRLQEKIQGLIDAREDSVLYYPLCSSCRTLRERTGLGSREKGIKTLFVPTIV